MYKNEKLNISIENEQYFKIVEKDSYVELVLETVKKFTIYANSTVYASANSTVYASDNSTVTAYGNSTVYARANSTVWAHEFSCIHQFSINAKITSENHFGAIICQVFKLKKQITVYKKLEGQKIAVLQLEKGQIFQSERHEKCRTDRAIVVMIESIDGKTQYTDGCSIKDSNFKYEVGKTVSAVYDENIEECASGIHFFLTREKAEKFSM